MRDLTDPRGRVLAGFAEDVPLEDGSVDAVVVGQAWHWFDEAKAVEEV
jgi:ubiquinone/menaquinone biosynthesis C-methylase UbiE